MVATSLFARVVGQDHRVEAYRRLGQFVFREFVFNAVIVRRFVVSHVGYLTNVRFAYFSVNIFAVGVVGAMDSVQHLLGFNGGYPNAGAIGAPYERRRGVSQVGFVFLGGVYGYVVVRTIFVFFQYGLFEGSQARFNSFIDARCVPRFDFAF